MASTKTSLTGYMVGLYIEKTEGSGEYTRVLCANSITFDVTTEALATDCQDTEDADGNYASSDPGQISWTAGTEMTARQITGDDAATNITAENMLDYQLAGRKLQLRYQLGKAVGSAVYAGQVWISKNGFSGANKDKVSASVAFTGTGPLTKTLVAEPTPAPTV